MAGEPTPASLAAAAKARGIPLTEGEAQPIVAGASWLKHCVALLRKAGLGK